MLTRRHLSWGGVETRFLDRYCSSPGVVLVDHSKLDVYSRDAFINENPLILCLNENKLSVNSTWSIVYQ